MFNAVFMPIIYFLYPETGELSPQQHSLTQGWDTNDGSANRTLEDLDEYYRSNPPVVVTKDPDAICSKRPLKYIEKEETHLRRIIRASQDIDRDKSHTLENEHIESSGA